MMKKWSIFALFGDSLFFRYFHSGNHGKQTQDPFSQNKQKLSTFALKSISAFFAVKMMKKWSIFALFGDSLFFRYFYSGNHGKQTQDPFSQNKQKLSTFARRSIFYFSAIKMVKKWSIFGLFGDSLFFRYFHSGNHGKQTQDPFSQNKQKLSTFALKSISAFFAVKMMKKWSIFALFGDSLFFRYFHSGNHGKQTQDPFSQNKQKLSTFALKSISAFFAVKMMKKWSIFALFGDSLFFRYFYSGNHGKQTQDPFSQNKQKLSTFARRSIFDFSAIKMVKKWSIFGLFGDSLFFRYFYSGNHGKQTQDPFSQNKQKLSTFARRSIFDFSAIKMVKKWSIFGLFGDSLCFRYFHSGNHGKQTQDPFSQNKQKLSTFARRSIFDFSAIKMVKKWSIFGLFGDSLFFRYFHSGDHGKQTQDPFSQNKQKLSTFALKSISAFFAVKMMKKWSIFALFGDSLFFRYFYSGNHGKQSQDPFSQNKQKLSTFARRSIFDFSAIKMVKKWSIFGLFGDSLFFRYFYSGNHGKQTQDPFSQNKQKLSTFARRSIFYFSAIKMVKKWSIFALFGDSLFFRYFHSGNHGKQTQDPFSQNKQKLSTFALKSISAFFAVKMMKKWSIFALFGDSLFFRYFYSGNHGKQSQDPFSQNKQKLSTFARRSIFDFSAIKMVKKWSIFGLFGDSLFFRYFYSGNHGKQTQDPFSQNKQKLSTFARRSIFDFSAIKMVKKWSIFGLFGDSLFFRYFHSGNHGKQTQDPFSQNKQKLSTFALKSISAFFAVKMMKKWSIFALFGDSLFFRYFYSGNHGKQTQDPFSQNKQKLSTFARRSIFDFSAIKMVKKWSIFGLFGDSLFFRYFYSGNHGKQTQDPFSQNKQKLSTFARRSIFDFSAIKMVKKWSIFGLFGDSLCFRYFHSGNHGKQTQDPFSQNKQKLSTFARRSIFDFSAIKMVKKWSIFGLFGDSLFFRYFHSGDHGKQTQDPFSQNKQKLSTFALKSISAFFAVKMMKKWSIFALFGDSLFFRYFYSGNHGKQTQDPFSQNKQKLSTFARRSIFDFSAIKMVKKWSIFGLFGDSLFFRYFYSGNHGKQTQDPFSQNKQKLSTFARRSIFYFSAIKMVKKWSIFALFGDSLFFRYFHSGNHGKQTQDPFSQNKQKLSTFALKSISAFFAVKMMKKWSIFALFGDSLFFRYFYSGNHGKQSQDPFSQNKQKLSTFARRSIFDFSAIKMVKKWSIFGLFGDSLFFRYFYSGNHGKQTQDPFSQNKQKLSTFARRSIFDFSAIKMVKKWSIFGLFGDSLFFRYFNSGNHGKQTQDPFSQNKQKLSTFARRSIFDFSAIKMVKKWSIFALFGDSLFFRYFHSGDHGKQTQDPFSQNKQKLSTFALKSISAFFAVKMMKKWSIFALFGDSLFFRYFYSGNHGKQTQDPFSQNKQKLSTFARRSIFDFSAIKMVKKWSIFGLFGDSLFFRYFYSGNHGKQTQDPFSQNKQKLSTFARRSIFDFSAIKMVKKWSIFGLFGDSLFFRYFHSGNHGKQTQDPFSQNKQKLSTFSRRSIFDFSAIKMVKKWSIFGLFGDSLFFRYFHSGNHGKQTQDPFSQNKQKLSTFALKSISAFFAVKMMKKWSIFALFGDSLFFRYFHSGNHGKQTQDPFSQNKQKLSTFALKSISAFFAVKMMKKWSIFALFGDSLFFRYFYSGNHGKQTQDPFSQNKQKLSTFARRSIFDFSAIKMVKKWSIFGLFGDSLFFRYFYSGNHGKQTQDPFSQNKQKLSTFARRSIFDFSAIKMVKKWSIFGLFGDSLCFRYFHSGNHGKQTQDPFSQNKQKLSTFARRSIFDFSAIKMVKKWSIFGLFGDSLFFRYFHSGDHGKQTQDPFSQNKQKLSTFALKSISAFFAVKMMKKWSIFALFGDSLFFRYFYSGNHGKQTQDPFSQNKQKLSTFARRSIFDFSAIKMVKKWSIFGLFGDSLFFRYFYSGNHGKQTQDPFSQNKQKLSTFARRSIFYFSAIKMVKKWSIFALFGDSLFFRYFHSGNHGKQTQDPFSQNKQKLSTFALKSISAFFAVKMMKKWSIFALFGDSLFFRYFYSGNHGKQSQDPFSQNKQKLSTFARRSIFDFSAIKMVKKWSIFGLFGDSLFFRYFYSGNHGKQTQDPFSQNKQKLSTFARRSIFDFSAIKMVKKWSIFGLFGDSLFFRYFHSGNHGKQTQDPFSQNKQKLSTFARRSIFDFSAIKMVKKWSIFGLFGDSLFFRYFHSGDHGKQTQDPFSQNKQKLSTFALKSISAFFAVKMMKKWSIFALFGDSLFFRYFYSGNHGKQTQDPFSQNKQKLSTFARRSIFDFSAIKMVKKWSIFGLFGDSLFFRYFYSGNHGKQTQDPFSQNKQKLSTFARRSIFDFSAIKWSKNGPFLDFLEIVYFFVISTQGIMGNKLRTLFHKISKNYPLFHEGQFLTFLPSKWSKNGPFLDFLEIVYFFVISTQGIMGNKLRTLFHKISKNYPLLH